MPVDRERPSRAVRVVLSVGTGVLLLAGCADEGEPVAGPGGSSAAVTEPTTASTTTTPASASPSPEPSTESSAPAGAGCPAVGDGVPAGAGSATIVDVDGDGRPDTGWLTGDGPVRLGVTTASGASFGAPVELAGPADRQALFADLTGAGEIVALVSDGRTADLFTVTGCALAVVHNAEGDQYQFDLGFRGNGTGVGCVDATGDGVPDLVGLNLRVDDDGDPVQVDRTVIDLDGDQARNGATDTVPATDAAAQSATTITCGDLTIADDGVSLRG